MASGGGGCSSGSNRMLSFSVRCRHQPHLNMPPPAHAATAVLDAAQRAHPVAWATKARRSRGPSNRPYFGHHVDSRAAAAPCSKGVSECRKPCNSRRKLCASLPVGNQTLGGSAKGTFGTPFTRRRPAAVSDANLSRGLALSARADQVAFLRVPALRSSHSNVATDQRGKRR